MKFLGILMLSGFALAGAPGMAGADYFLSKSDARFLTRDAVGKRYGEYGVHAHCTPSFRSYDPDYTYNKWDCYWDNASCAGGKLRLTGRKDFSDRFNAYKYVALEPPSCSE